MGIVSWLVVGAIAGYLTGFVLRGDERFGVAWHVVLGIIGAAIGGLIAGLVTGIDYVTGFDLTTIVAATIGAVVAVIVWNAVAKGRWTGGRVA